MLNSAKTIVGRYAIGWDFDSEAGASLIETDLRKVGSSYATGPDMMPRERGVEEGTFSGHSLFKRQNNNQGVEMKKVTVLLAATLALFIIAGSVVVPDYCGAQETIKIGVPLPLTGRHSPFGQHEKRALDLAIEEINAAGGVKGKKLEAVYADDQSKPEAAITAAQKLLDDDSIIMLTGEYASSETYPIAALAEKKKVPFVVSVAAADNITQSGWKYIFRLAQPASEFDSSLQDYLLNVAKPASMVIFYENTLFGTSVAKGMKEWADKNNIKVLLFDDYEAGLVDFKPILFKIKAANPDVIYAISYLMDATLITRQMKEIGLNAKMFAGSAAGYSIPEYLEGAGDAAEYVFTSTMWERTVPYPGAKEFDQKYQDKYKLRPPYHAAQAYSSAYICADALNRAKELNRDSVREALETTDLMTMYGQIKFKAYGKYERQSQLPTLVLQVLKGKFEIVWPENLSTAKSIYPVPKWEERK
jgi:branched-chain amino acid transport system substrate-binding protein